MRRLPCDYKLSAKRVTESPPGTPLVAFHVKTATAAMATMTSLAVGLCDDLIERMETTDGKEIAMQTVNCTGKNHFDVVRFVLQNGFKLLA